MGLLLLATEADGGIIVEATSINEEYKQKSVVPGRLDAQKTVNALRRAMKKHLVAWLNSGS